MAAEVERFIRIQNLVAVRGKAEREWRIIPNGARVRVWEMSNADALTDDATDDLNTKLFIFHIGYTDGIVRGTRVSYMGSNFLVRSASDSTRLRGLELRCVPAPAAD